MQLYLLCTLVVLSTKSSASLFINLIAVLVKHLQHLFQINDIFVKRRQMTTLSIAYYLPLLLCQYRVYRVIVLKLCGSMHWRAQNRLDGAWNLMAVLN